jgi:SP family myo-inositol transporter-like MFS transporter 13
LLHIQEEFNTSEAMSEFIVAAAKLGAVAGTFLGGALMLYYGRRFAIAADSFFFITGPLIMATAWNVAGLIIGRFLVGIGIGISAVVVPAYLGEVAPAKARGRVVELYEVMLCLGMLTSALADAALDDVTGNWRWMVGAPAIPAILMSCKLSLLLQKKIKKKSRCFFQLDFFVDSIILNRQEASPSISQ